MVLANAFKTNDSLTELVLDGNRIGKRGGESLMAAVMRSQTAERFVSVSLKNCDLDFVDHSTSGFNPMEPTLKTQLTLSRPYDMMVASELLRLANTRLGCRFASLEYRAKNGTKFEKVNLYRATPPGSNNKDWKELAVSFLDTIRKARRNPFERPDLPDKIMEILSTIGMSPTEAVLVSTVKRLKEAFVDGHLDIGAHCTARRQAAFAEMERQLSSLTGAATEGTTFEGGLQATEFGVTGTSSTDRRRGFMGLSSETHPTREGQQADPKLASLGQSPEVGRSKIVANTAADRNEEAQDLMEFVFGGFFNMIDVDNSRNLDSQELTACLALLGLNFDPPHVKRVT